MIWPEGGATFQRGDALVFFWRPGVSALYSGFEADTVGPLGENRLPYRSLDGNVTGTLGAQKWYLIQRSCSGSASCLSDWRERTFNVDRRAGLAGRADRALHRRDRRHRHQLDRNRSVAGREFAGRIRRKGLGLQPRLRFNLQHRRQLRLPHLAAD